MSRKVTFQTEVTLVVTVEADVELAHGPTHNSDGSPAEPDDHGAEVLSVYAEDPSGRKVELSSCLCSEQFDDLASEAMQEAELSADED